MGWFNSGSVGRPAGTSRQSSDATQTLETFVGREGRLLPSFRHTNRWDNGGKALKRTVLVLQEILAFRATVIGRGVKSF